MSLLAIIIACGIVGAAAFFFAGFLLRSPGRRGPDEAEVALREGLTAELAAARGQLTAVEQELSQAQSQLATAAGRESQWAATQQELNEVRWELTSVQASHGTELQAVQQSLDEAKAQLAQVETARRAEAEKRAAEESKRDAQDQVRTRIEADLAKAREELSRLTGRERILAERLRSAEQKNRAAFEREEESAAAWHAQLEATKEERQRRDQALAKELEELRRENTRQQAEGQKLAAEQSRLQSDLQRALEESRKQAAAAQQAETVWQEKLSAAKQTALAEQAVLRKQVEALTAKLEQTEQTSRAGQDESGNLKVTVRALEEALEQERARTESATQDLHRAEARLKDQERLAQENVELREQQQRAAQEAKEFAEREGESRDARVELAAAQAKLTELATLLEENRKLRDQVAELRLHQDASGELERLSATHKQLRLDAELMARRLQELQHDQAELVPLRAQANEAAELQEEVIYLRSREKDLEAKLYSVGFYASREIPILDVASTVSTPVTDMETNLQSLVRDNGPRTAVLADSQGFLIASAGQSAPQEGLAAFAAVASDMVARARMLLPLADVKAVQVTDANHMVLTCQLFESDGQGLGVSTLGPSEPEAETTVRAVQGLTTILSASAAEREPTGSDG